MAESRYVTIMLVPDGTEPRSGWRMRQWLLKTLVVAFIALIVGIVLFFSFYGQVLKRAALTEQVMQENEDLKRYYYKVQLLEQNLLKAREVVERMTTLAGVDYEFPEIPTDSMLFARMNNRQPAIVERPADGDWTLPAGMPLEGFITQRFEIDDPDRYHPGVDVACAIGSGVLATGSGMVESVDYDSTYGNLVVLRHNDSVTTVYAHNDQILVRPGDHVAVGSRIALSGNSGRSTAPHLHYEIRVNGKPIDPLDNPYDEKEQHK
ncbi:peptidoglycan DD-metalloendopeptidase family protein [candidate division GN15 bacterium]|nr:peptidoglycan DD-metalloendopeptidase family protein [candidate division GN15 bacterium]